MHSDPELGRRGGGVSYIDARKKGSGSRHSEKELPALSVKNTPGSNHLESYGEGI
jgi:hypothetical protein